MHEKLRDSLSQLCRSKASASSAKIIYSNLANDTVRSVKTTAPDLNNKIALEVMLLPILIYKLYLQH